MTSSTDESKQCIDETNTSALKEISKSIESLALQCENMFGWMKSMHSMIEYNEDEQQKRYKSIAEKQEKLERKLDEFISFILENSSYRDSNKSTPQMETMFDPEKSVTPILETNKPDKEIFKVLQENLAQQQRNNSYHKLFIKLKNDNVSTKYKDDPNKTPLQSFILSPIYTKYGKIKPQKDKTVFYDDQNGKNRYLFYVFLIFVSCPQYKDIETYYVMGVLNEISAQLKNSPLKTGYKAVYYLYSHLASDKVQNFTIHGLWDNKIREIYEQSSKISI